MVPEYLNNGIFTPRPSEMTISNAMDVGDPSNFARILEMYDHKWMAVKADIQGYSFTDDQTRAIMKDVYKRTGYILDPHGAVGYLGLKEYKKFHSFSGIFPFDCKYPLV